MKDKNYKLCFLVPVYKHVSTLAKVLERLKSFNLPVIVVDDGNSKEDHALLEQICAPFSLKSAVNQTLSTSNNNLDTSALKIDESDLDTKEDDAFYDKCWVKLISYPLNQGKGHAVCQGLAWAYTHGFSHTLQVDADLQHDINDVPKFISLSLDNQNAVISGKPIYDGSVPKSRLYGRKITDFWVAIETLSLDIKDSMCGFRLYPLAPAVACINQYGFKRRMDFDIDFFVKLYRKGMEFLYIDTKVIYPEDGHSNFQALKDNIAISMMHTTLVLTLPWHLKALIKRKFKQKNDKHNLSTKSLTDSKNLECDANNLLSSNALSDNTKGNVKACNNASSTDKHWERKPEKHGLLGMEILLFIRKYGGTWLFKCSLFIVVTCFWAFDSKARLASNNWFKAVNDYRQKRSLPLYQNTSSLSHFYTFALAMYDKIAAWDGQIVLNKNAFLADQTSVNIVNEIAQREKGSRGVVVLCSHLGNMEVCRALASQNGTTVNALMHTKNSQRFKEIMDKYIKVDDLNIIEVESIDAYSAMLLDEKIAQGEFVAIAADRVAVSNKEAVCHVPFMDKIAAIPKGPFILANVLKCDVFLIFSAKTKDGTQIFFERFVMPDKISRADREEQLYKLCSDYAQRLEYYASLYPNQWFNFYDYFVNSNDEQNYGK